MTRPHHVLHRRFPRTARGVVMPQGSEDRAKSSHHASTGPTRVGAAHRSGTLGAAVAAIACLMIAPSAHADVASDSAAAQSLFEQARQLMANGKFKDACPKLEESQRLDPGSGTLINLADCYERDGRGANAWATFLQAEAASQKSGNAAREKTARERAAALAARLPRVSVRVTNDKLPGLTIRRDGEIIPATEWGAAVPVDPGSHVITAEAPNRKPWRRETLVEGRATTTIVVPELDVVATTTTTLAASESGPRSSTFGAQRTAALGAAGLGVAGLAVGTIFGLQAISKHDRSADLCEGSSCPQSAIDLRSESQQGGNVATAGFIVGGVGLAAAGVLWFTAPKRAVQTGLWLSPNHVGLRGVW